MIVLAGNIHFCGLFSLSVKNQPLILTGSGPELYNSIQSDELPSPSSSVNLLLTINSLIRTLAFTCAEKRSKRTRICFGKKYFIIKYRVRGLFFFAL